MLLDRLVHRLDNIAKLQTELSSPSRKILHSFNSPLFYKPPRSPLVVISCVYSAVETEFDTVRNKNNLNADHYIFHTADLSAS